MAPAKKPEKPLLPKVGASSGLGGTKRSLGRRPVVDMNDVTQDLDPADLEILDQEPDLSVSPSTQLVSLPPPPPPPDEEGSAVEAEREEPKSGGGDAVSPAEPEPSASPEALPEPSASPRRAAPEERGEEPSVVIDDPEMRAVADEDEEGRGSLHDESASFFSRGQLLSELTSARDETPQRGLPWLWIILGVLVVGMLAGGVAGLANRQDGGNAANIVSSPPEPPGVGGRRGLEPSLVSAGVVSGAPAGDAAVEGGDGAAVDAAATDGAEGDAAPAEGDSAIEDELPADSRPRVPTSTVAVTLQGLPPRARVRLDGGRVDTARVAVPDDGREHTIEVSASGYRRWSRTLTARESQVIVVTMQERTGGGPGGSTKRVRRLVRDPGF